MAESPGAQRPHAPQTAKSKNAVQRSVTALLDALAPERVLKRGGVLAGPVEQHRTPSGCVLQAADAAVSVSWFADAGEDAVLGEMHIVAWHGTVTRPGTPPTEKGATVAGELVVRPIEPPRDHHLWVANDGTTYDTAGLAAVCMAMLKQG